MITFFRKLRKSIIEYLPALRHTGSGEYLEFQKNRNQYFKEESDLCFGRYRS